MCEKCKDLKEVEINKKKSLLIRDRISVDSITDRTFMIVLNEDNKKSAIIKNELTILSTGRSYDNCIEITHCPFCGEKLI